MKTKLTLEESARLIELGIDLKMASECVSAMKVYASGRGIIRLPESNPIFTLPDLLSILPKEIDYNGLTYELNLWVYKATWYIEYVVETEFNQWDALNTDNFDSPELIDALYQLLIWAIENNYVKPNKDN